MLAKNPQLWDLGNQADTGSRSWRVTGSGGSTFGDPTATGGSPTATTSLVLEEPVPLQIVLILAACLGEQGDLRTLELPLILKQASSPVSLSLCLYLAKFLIFLSLSRLILPFVQCCLFVLTFAWVFSWG